MHGLKVLKKGAFNHMSVECLNDGSQIVTLSKDGSPKVYKFRVMDLYGPNEQELDLETGEPLKSS